MTGTVMLMASVNGEEGSNAGERWRNSDESWRREKMLELYAAFNNEGVSALTLSSDGSDPEEEPEGFATLELIGLRFGETVEKDPIYEILNDKVGYRDGHYEVLLLVGDELCAIS